MEKRSTQPVNAVPTTIVLFIALYYGNSIQTIFLYFKNLHGHFCEQKKNRPLIVEVFFNSTIRQFWKSHYT